MGLLGGRKRLYSSQSGSNEDPENEDSENEDFENEDPEIPFRSPFRRQGAPQRFPRPRDSECRGGREVRRRDYRGS